MTTINLWFINYPLCSFSRLLDEIRTNSSDASCSVYCAFMMVLMFKRLIATCLVGMRSSCEHVLVFPHMSRPLILHFSLLFPFLCIFSLFSFCSRVCVLSKLPFSILRFPSKSFMLLFLFSVLYGRLFCC